MIGDAFVVLSKVLVTASATEHIANYTSFHHLFLYSYTEHICDDHTLDFQESYQDFGAQHGIAVIPHSCALRRSTQ